jgi:hypothetical protein
MLYKHLTPHEINGLYAPHPSSIRYFWRGGWLRDDLPNSRQAPLLPILNCLTKVALQENIPEREPRSDGVAHRFLLIKDVRKGALHDAIE